MLRLCRRSRLSGAGADALGHAAWKLPKSLEHPEECYSSSRTCEIGMSRATGQVYRSYLYLLEKATR